MNNLLSINEKELLMERLNKNNYTNLVLSVYSVSSVRNKVRNYKNKQEKKMKTKSGYFKKIILLLTLLLLFTPSLGFTQSDTRYDSGLNLPFNKKAGNVNPQTGNITLKYTDVALPGRAGMNFTFTRIWNLNQSNVYAMNKSVYDGSSYLTSDTIEKYNNMGIGWTANIPYVYTDDNSDIQNLFFNGNVYELNTALLPVYNSNNSNIHGYDLLNLRVYSGVTGSAVSYGDYNNGIMPTGYPVDDAITDLSEYVLILKDNSKYYFRPDGKLMMHQDRTKLNQIWYFYEEYETDKTRLSLVVDTIGREIEFLYNADGNLSSIEWQVDVGSKDISGTRTYETEDRKVEYFYVDAEKTKAYHAKENS